MTITDMLGQSLLLTVLGIGIVFTFLIILILFISLAAKVIKALKLDKDISTENSTASSANATDKNKVVAAIVAAIREKQTN